MSGHRGPNNRPVAWTEHMDRRLRHAAANGIRRDEVARIIGVTEAQARAREHDIGVVRKAAVARRRA